MNRLLSLAEACAALGISAPTGRKAIKDGTFPVEAIRVGGTFKVRAADIDRLIDGTQPTQPPGL